MPTAETWLLSVTRHWYLDWDGPRAERDVAAAAEATLRDHEAHQRAASGEDGGSGEAGASVEDAGVDPSAHDQVVDAGDPRL